MLLFEKTKLILERSIFLCTYFQEHLRTELEVRKTSNEYTSLKILGVNVLAEAPLIMNLYGVLLAKYNN